MVAPCTADHPDHVWYHAVASLFGAWDGDARPECAPGTMRRECRRSVFATSCWKLAKRRARSGHFISDAEAIGICPTIGRGLCGERGLLAQTVSNDRPDVSLKEKPQPTSTFSRGCSSAHLAAGSGLVRDCRQPCGGPNDQAVTPHRRPDRAGLAEARHCITNTPIYCPPRPRARGSRIRSGLRSGELTSEKACSATKGPDLAVAAQHSARHAVADQRDA